MNMSELNFFKATIRESYVDAKGREKFRKENYIVSAISPTDVEAKLAKELSDAEYEVVNVTLTNIVKILN